MTVTTGLALGPFEAVRGLAYDAPFPDMLRVRQHVDRTRVDDPEAETLHALEPLRPRITPGMRVAVTAGSRGITDLPAVVRAAGRWLTDAGAEPFVVPAMGSHAGATAEGQQQMLASLGVTEETVGMPVRATMDTVEVDRLPDGPAVHLDRYAAEADGILAVNRVKPHTDFHGEVESGLAKIVAIGLGKRRGAEGIHAYGSASLAHWVPQVAQRIAKTGTLLGGLAICENAEHRTASVAFVPPEGIGGDAENALLERTRGLMGALPFDEVDVLVVDDLGKNRSGSGMDTNVIGRMMIRGTEEFARPNIANIAVLDVTDASHGNAIGVGLADYMPFRILEKIDLSAVYVNAITSGIGGPQRAQLPITLPTDRDAVAAAILTCGRADVDRARVVRIRNTLDVLDLQVSTSLRSEVDRDPALSFEGDCAMTFDTDGTLAGW